MSFCASDYDGETNEPQRECTSAPDWWESDDSDCTPVGAVKAWGRTMRAAQRANEAAEQGWRESLSPETEERGNGLLERRVA